MGAVCAALVAAQSETYTLLHRVQTIGEDGKQVNMPWQPRALVRYPTTVAGDEGLVVNEGIPSEMVFPPNDENAFYQIKIVEGDARTFSADVWPSKVNGKEGISTMTKLVREPLSPSVNCVPRQESRWKIPLRCTFPNNHSISEILRRLLMW